METENSTGAVPKNGASKTSYSSELLAEGEIDTCDVLEVVLPRRVAGDVVGTEVRRQIVHFYGTELDGTRDGDVQADAVLHGEAIVAPAARETSDL